MQVLDEKKIGLPSPKALINVLIHKFYWSTWTESCWVMCMVATNTSEIQVYITYFNALIL